MNWSTCGRFDSLRLEACKPVIARHTAVLCVVTAGGRERSFSGTA